MNYYTKIREKRNEMFPPRLEFGCEVEKISNKKIYKVLQTDSHTKYSKTDQDKIEVCGTSWGLLPKTDCKILGTQVTLQEILMMLQSKHDVKMGGKNEFIIKKFSGRDILILDLTKEIKDQSEDTLKSIYELIT